jgi:hypothetical protein
MTGPPLWRQAFDAAERTVTPRAENLVRTPSFSTGVALVRRARTLARDSVQEVTARAWHLLNLPAGTDVSRLRAQIGSLDREVRRLSAQLESERRRASRSAVRPTASIGPADDTQTTEDHRADSSQSAGGARPGTPRRRAQRPAGP